MEAVPSWVEKQKRKGCVVKHIGERYYLYSNKSKRVPGKRYPQPVQRCLGQITEEGLIVSLKVPFENSGIRVYEYGFSIAVITIWNRYRDAFSRFGEEVLQGLIISECPDSWFGKSFDETGIAAGMEDIRECRKLICRLSGQTFDVLKDLQSIKMLQFNAGTSIPSHVDDDQRRLLEELGVDICGNVSFI